MRFSTDRYDAMARQYCTANPNMAVPWWLMAAFMYEIENDPFLSDACFDWLSAELLARWDEIEHRHKALIDREALRAGTALAADLRNLPTIVTNAARHLVANYTAAHQIAPQACRYCEGSGWFYSMRDLGPCSCADGNKRALESIDDLLGVSAPEIEDLL